MSTKKPNRGRRIANTAPPKAKICPKCGTPMDWLMGGWRCPNINCNHWEQAERCMACAPDFAAPQAEHNPHGVCHRYHRGSVAKGAPNYRVRRRLERAPADERGELLDRMAECSDRNPTVSAGGFRL